IRRISRPISTASASPRLCATSVLTTSVRLPRAAAARAVAAETVVLPTPPLPVNRMIRIGVLGCPLPFYPEIRSRTRGAAGRPAHQTAGGRGRKRLRAPARKRPPRSQMERGDRPNVVTQPVVGDHLDLGYPGVRTALR